MLCFANRHSSFRLFRLDGAEVGLVFADVVLERHQQSLGVFRSHDDSALHAGLWSVWHHADEVHKELIYRVCDDSQVGIFTRRHFRSQFNLYFSLVVFLIHNFKMFRRLLCAKLLISRKLAKFFSSSTFRARAGREYQLFRHCVLETYYLCY